MRTLQPSHRLVLSARSFSGSQAFQDSPELVLRAARELHPRFLELGTSNMDVGSIIPALREHRVETILRTNFRGEKKDAKKVGRDAVAMGRSGPSMMTISHCAHSDVVRAVSEHRESCSMVMLSIPLLMTEENIRRQFGCDLPAFLSGRCEKAKRAGLDGIIVPSRWLPLMPINEEDPSFSVIASGVSVPWAVSGERLSPQQAMMQGASMVSLRFTSLYDLPDEMGEGVPETPEGALDEVLASIGRGMTSTIEHPRITRRRQELEREEAAAAITT